MQWLTEETGWILPEESGLPGQLSESMPHASPERLLRLGAALAQASPRCMAGYAPDAPHAGAAAMTLAGAVSAAGGNAVLVPDCVPAELADASAAGDCGLVLHIAETRMRIYAGGLLPLTQAQEQAIAQAYAESAPHWMQGSEYGTVSDGRSLRLLYSARLNRSLPAVLPADLQFSTGAKRLHALMQRVFRGGRGEALTVQLSEDGRRCSLYSERHGWVFYEKLLLLLCQHRLSLGESVALPYWVPQIAEEIAAASGGRILRYASRSDGADTEARMLARQQGFTLEAGSLLADFLRICAESEPDLTRWMQALPPCHTVRRILQTDDAAEAAARCGGYLQTERTPEGLRATDHRGSALLRPSHTGHSISLLVEARSMEAAAELAADIAVWAQPH